MTNGIPYNPLDAFQSYSVQYVLLACRTTVTAALFASEDQNSMRASLQAIDEAKYLGSPVSFAGRSNDIYLVLDTRRFSQFTVESLKYDVYVNGLQKGASQANLAADLSMTILDSVGISFANFMQWLLDSQMKTNYDGLVFMLRTIFVGHKADGSTEVVQTETIPMHLQRMDIDLNYTKGAYTLEFMPNMNFDVNQNARFLTVSTATKYHSTDNTLLGLITSFETELNRRSNDYFQEIQKIVSTSRTPQQSGTPTTSSNKPPTLGRKVQYMITIPKKWEKWQLTGSSLGSVIETAFKAQNDQARKDADAIKPSTTTSQNIGQIRDSYFATHTGANITDVLDAILKTIPEVAAMGNFKQSDVVEGGMITFYKHIVGLTSDDSTLVVHVDIVEFQVPNLFTNQKPTDVSKVEDQMYYTTKDENGREVRKPRDFLEWEYIFTGKNDSILNFDMKIQDFQFLLASNIRIGDGALREVADGSGETDDSSLLKNDELLFARQYDPLVLPLDSKSALENFRRYSSIVAKQDQSQQRIKETQQYSKNLSMFYAGSPIVVAMTIKGNPLIMHKFNMGQLLPHATGATVGTGSGSNAPGVGQGGNLDRNTYRQKLEQDILKANKEISKTGDSLVLKSPLSQKSYATSPVFARVNIKGPSVDFKTNAPLDDGTFSSSVLSNNYYVIFKVTNIISGHLFTQELELYSHNIYGGTKITSTKS